MEIALHTEIVDHTSKYGIPGNWRAANTGEGIYALKLISQLVHGKKVYG